MVAGDALSAFQKAVEEVSEAYWKMFLKIGSDTLNFV